MRQDNNGTSTQVVLTDHDREKERLAHQHDTGSLWNPIRHTKSNCSYTRWPKPKSWYLSPYLWPIFVNPSCIYAHSRPLFLSIRIIPTQFMFLHYISNGKLSFNFIINFWTLLLFSTANMLWHISPMYSWFMLYFHAYMSLNRIFPGSYILTLAFWPAEHLPKFIYIYKYLCLLGVSPNRVLCQMMHVTCRVINVSVITSHC